MLFEALQYLRPQNIAAFAAEQLSFGELAVSGMYGGLQE